MIPYILHSSILLTGCFLFYWFFIRNETFFNLNRWVLITSILLSVTIPTISVPESWSIRPNEKIDLLEPAIPAEEIPITKKPEKPIASAEKEEIKDADTSLTNFAKKSTQNSESDNTGFAIPYPTLLWYIYLMGVAVFFLAFLVQLLILLTKMYTLISFKDGRFRIVELVKDEAPYSFWNSIFINPAKYDLETYTQIMEHEKIHIQQAHFIDKLIAEVLLIAFWFNPFVWMLRNAITNNLEYLTDSSMLENGVEKHTYQLSLLKVSVPQHPLNLSTNYNNSFLKNRIAMMNAKKSSASSSWKYLFLLPLLGCSVLFLNDVQSQEVELISEMEHTPSTKQDTIPEKRIDMNISATTSKTNVKETTVTESTAADTGHFTAIEATSMLSSNSTSETTIVTTDESVFISGHDISVNDDYSSNRWNTTVRPGHWVAEIDGDHICFELNNSRPAKHSTWITHECFKKSELSDIPKGVDKDFHIKRAAGTLNFNGSFSDGSGSGTFAFQEDAAFSAFLKGQGMELKKDGDMLHLFLNNVDKDYVNNLKAEGFKADGKDLVQLSVHGITKDKIKGFVQIFKDLDYKGYKVRDLIQFEIHDVDPAYVNEIRAQGMTDLTVKEIVQAKIHDVEPEFIKSVRDYGLKDVDLKDIIQFSIHDVDSDYINEMKNLGFRNLSAQDIVQSSIHDVSPRYIKSIHEAGFTDMSMHDLIQFSIHDIDVKDIRAFKDAGFEFSTQDIIQAGIHNVTAKYIKEMRDMGFKEADLDDFVEARIHGVNSSFIKRAREKGHNPKTLKEYVRLKIMGI